MKHFLIIAMILISSVVIFSQEEINDIDTSTDLSASTEKGDPNKLTSTTDDNYAILNIFRPTNEFRSNKFFIFFETELVSLIKAKTYQQFKIPVGKFTILIKSQNWEVIQGNVVKGKTYNILLKLYRGFHFAIAVPEFVSINDQRLQSIYQNQSPVLAKQNEIEAAKKEYSKDALLVLEKVQNNTAKFVELIAVD